MRTLHHRGALFAAFSLLAHASCGGRAGVQQDNQGDVAGAEGFSCLPGDTRECVGPGACRGGQQCSTQGLWGSCACGPTGGTAATAASAGATAGGQGNRGGDAGGMSLAGATSAGSPGSWAGQGTGGYEPTGGAGGRGGGGGTGGRSARGGSGPSGGNGSGGAATGGSAAGTSATGGVATGGAATGGAPTGGTSNSPPTITDLTFYPAAPTTDDTLYAYPKATDPDLDAVTYSYAWTCNGNAVGSDTSQLNGWLYFSKGDEIKVTVTPGDGKSSGDPVTSQAIIVVNAPPAFYYWQPDLSPYSYAVDDDSLTCSASATDPDSDPITYTYNWYQADTLTNYHDSELPARATSMGESWSCEVSATDGDLSAWSGRSSTTDIVSLVGGIYRADTTWQASQSPYIFTDRIQIAAGVTLKIEPGVRVVGNGNSLESWGSVSMLGTSEEPILIEDLNMYDYSTTDNPGKVALSFVEYVRGSLLSSANGARVEVSDCVLRELGGSICLPAGLSDAHRFERNLLLNSCGIYAAGPVTLSDNTFASNYYYCNALNFQDSVVASSNSFYPSPYFGTEIMVLAGPTSVDLRGSYWGGLSDDEIPDRIYDNNDDLSVTGEVQYLPTLAEPSPDAPPLDKTYFPQQ